VASTLVLIHGGTVTSTMWDDVVSLLHSPAIAPDLPGRRYRPADLGTITRQDWVDAVVNDICAAQLDDVVLVGHSSGGYVLPGVAALLPAVVRRLVFVAATIPGDGRRPVDYLKPKLRELSLAGEVTMRARARGRTLGGLRPGEPAIATDLEVVDNGPRMGLEAPGPLFETLAWSAAAASLPRTFVRCLHDRVVTPDLVERMIADMGGAEVVDIEAGHDIATEASEVLASLLDRLAHL
jgi:pimeloyl-ACP methyl ester carboxylesterase